LQALRYVLVERLKINELFRVHNELNGIRFECLCEAGVTVKKALSISEQCLPLQRQRAQKAA
jgi:hypothetical protein